MDKTIFLDVIFSAYFNKGTILPNNSFINHSDLFLDFWPNFRLHTFDKANRTDGLLLDISSMQSKKIMQLILYYLS
jgi:hypothetical protein